MQALTYLLALSAAAVTVAAPVPFPSPAPAPAPQATPAAQPPTQSSAATNNPPQQQQQQQQPSLTPSPSPAPSRAASPASAPAPAPEDDVWNSGSPAEQAKQAIKEAFADNNDDDGLPATVTRPTAGGPLDPVPIKPAHDAVENIPNRVLDTVQDLLDPWSPFRSGGGGAAAKYLCRQYDPAQCTSKCAPACASGGAACAQCFKSCSSSPGCEDDKNGARNDAPARNALGRNPWGREALLGGIRRRRASPAA